MESKVSLVVSFCNGKESIDSFAIAGVAYPLVPCEQGCCRKQQPGEQSELRYESHLVICEAGKPRGTVKH